LFCAALLESLDQTKQVLSVAFVGRREMRRINCRYLDRDYPTDVLSFSYEGVWMDGSPFLGEIVIAPGVALDHAVRYGNSAEKEIRKLLVHGILHLLGYDHEMDQGQMHRIQAKLLRRRFFLNAPPLARLRVTR
jgi:probable rRNA maturation factor